VGCLVMVSGFLNSAPMRASWCSVRVSSSLLVLSVIEVGGAAASGLSTISERLVPRLWVRGRLGELGGGDGMGVGLIL